MPVSYNRNSAYSVFSSGVIPLKFLTDSGTWSFSRRRPLYTTIRRSDADADAAVLGLESPISDSAWLCKPQTQTTAHGRSLPRFTRFRWLSSPMPETAIRGSAPWGGFHELFNGLAKHPYSPPEKRPTSAAVRPHAVSWMQFLSARSRCQVDARSLDALLSSAARPSRSSPKPAGLSPSAWLSRARVVVAIWGLHFARNRKCLERTAYSKAPTPLSPGSNT